jgi:PhnB protein|tara:strand:+ start:253 stop:606 length:354 start_codon:yes stop_codon:yes gene_type:complete
LIRIPSPDGTIGHAEIQIGDSRIMLSDESAEMDFQSPTAIGGTPVHIYLYVEDVDRIYAQALAAGAKSLMALEDQFWGDRTGTLVDPLGHRWYVSTHKEDLAEEELNARVAKFSKGP